LKVFLGIDGGGSKTEGVLAGADGRVLASMKVGASAIVGRPSRRSLVVLRSLTRSLLRRAGRSRGDVAFCAIGLNGIDFEDEFAMQKSAIARALGIPPRKIALVNDAVVALWGGSADPAAALLQVGSGITSALRSGFGSERTYDHLNAGSLFSLRHEILIRVARMIDGRIRPTPLKNAILRHLGVRDSAGYAELLYRGRLPWDRVARTPTIIFRFWLKGDPVARELVESAARDYAVTASAMVRRTGSRKATALVGGGVINNAPEAFRRLVHRRLREISPGARPLKPVMSPAHGACVMAAFNAGEDPAAFYGKLVD